MRDPAIEYVRDAILAAPNGAHRGEDAAFVGWPRTADQQIHRVMLPQVELASLRRQQGRSLQLAEADEAELDRSADPIGDETPLEV